MPRSVVLGTAVGTNGVEHGEFFEGASFDGGQFPVLGEKVRAFRGSDRNGGGQAPSRHSGVITGTENFRDGPTPEFRRSGVLGMFKKPISKALHHGGLFVAHDARNESSNRFGDGHGGHFPSAQHNVADGEFSIGEMIVDPLVEPFVTATHQRKAAGVDEKGGKFPRHSLGEPSPAGTEEEYRSGRSSLFNRCLHRGEHRAWGKHHAGPTAEGRVVDCLVDANAESSQVVGPYFEDATVTGATQQAGRRVGFDEFREQREDADPRHRERRRQRLRQ